MGNCQAAEAATVVIQHPGGRIDRLYWPTRAEDVMKSNPGHHVALVTLCIAQEKPTAEGGGGGHVRFTRVRLLKPKDMLLIGQVYRLIDSQEVSKALKARKLEKMKRAQAELTKKQLQLLQEESTGATATEQTMVFAHGAGRDHNQEKSQERDRARSSGGVSRPRQWRPTLQSISEGVASSSSSNGHGK